MGAMLVTAESSPEVLIVRAGTERRRTAAVDITVPIYNEEAELEASVRRLHRYLSIGSRCLG